MAPALQSVVQDGHSNIMDVDKPDVEAERERHRARAAKFGVEYVEPQSGRRELKAQMVAQQRADAGFTTGFDMFSQEELEKRQQRAERFGQPSAGIQWTGGEVAEDAEKRRARAERFGMAEDAEKLKARAERFGVTNSTQNEKDETGLMDVDLYEERKDVAADVERRLDVVHIYGVDLMSTKDILNYFGDYGPKFVEWINDSSANIVFNDSGTAERALVGMGTPMVNSDLPSGATLADPAAIKYVWFKGHDFKKGGVDIPLVLRVATVLDVKPAERVKSRRLWLTGGRGGRGGRGGQGRGKSRGRMGGKGAKGAKGGVSKKKGGHNRESDANMEEEGNARGRRLVDYDDL